ncbi:hypothetical protein K443DRAFT_379531 [Laccaria amethystina LaAM-08-1]|uniref:Ricin B lectin domain-containing protein n=1 Tax=Laccaria amethystina LaAM-08-1 TaxID=1095629 RepID=A0A0C9XJ41_9AGAR|nr:hypothetical protein K443DRAFT_379531 [Laccaria amethystina LaAM-08-1]
MLLLSNAFLFISLTLSASLKSGSAYPLSFLLRDWEPEICNPDFEGSALSVVGNHGEWGAQYIKPGSHVIGTSTRGAQVANPDFHFTLTHNGETPRRYVIQDVDNDIFVVGIVDNKLQLQNLNISNPTQIWKVECEFCDSGFAGEDAYLAAYDCAISSPTTEGCVQLGLNKTQPLTLVPCSRRDEKQSFQFWTANATARGE